MKCEDAKRLIDRYVDGDVESCVESAALEAHMSNCHKCRAEADELAKVRDLIRCAGRESPTEEEVESMLAAVQASGVCVIDETRYRIGGAGKWRFISACTATAACLLVAFNIGNMRMQRFEGMHLRTEVESSRGLVSEGQVRRGAAQLGGEPLAFGKGLASIGGGQGGEAVGRGYGVWADSVCTEKAEAGGAKEPSHGKSLGNAKAGRLSVGEKADVDSRLASLGYVDSWSEEKARGRERYFAGVEMKPTVGDAVADVERIPVDDDGEVEDFLFAGSYGTLVDGASIAWSWGRGGEREGAVYGEEKVASDGDVEVGKKKIAVSLKVIKTGLLTLEVDCYVGALEKLRSVCERFGGVVVDGDTKEQQGGAFSGKVVIRVPPNEFEGLFGELKEIGRVCEESSKAADVTAEYVDLEARIKSLRITEERLQELVKNKSFVDGMKALLEVEREMNRVRSEIEQLEGSLRVMAARVAFSTITVFLNEPARVVPSAKLGVEVSVLAGSLEGFGGLLERCGGRVVSGRQSRGGSGELVGTYDVRVKLALFGVFVDGICELGRLTQRDVLNWQAGDAEAEWASRVECAISLVMSERVGKMPSGSMEVEAGELHTVDGKLCSLVEEYGGLVGLRTSTQREDGSSVMTFDLRIPAGVYGKVVSRLGELGRVTKKDVSGDTGLVQGGAATTLCSLTLTVGEPLRQVPTGTLVIEVGGFEQGRDRLAELIGKFGASVLQSGSEQRADGGVLGSFRIGVVVSRVDGFVKELEGLGRVVSQQVQGVGLGKLSQADPKALGVISVTIGEKATISPGPGMAGNSIRYWTREGLAALYASVGVIVYGMVVILPWLIVVVLVGVVVCKLWRRRKSA